MIKTLAPLAVVALAAAAVAVGSAPAQAPERPAPVVSAHVVSAPSPAPAPSTALAPAPVAPAKAPETTAPASKPAPAPKPQPVKPAPAPKHSAPARQAPAKASAPADTGWQPSAGSQPQLPPQYTRTFPNGVTVTCSGYNVYPQEDGSCSNRPEGFHPAPAPADNPCSGTGTECLNGTLGDPYNGIPGLMGGR